MKNKFPILKIHKAKKSNVRFFWNASHFYIAKLIKICNEAYIVHKNSSQELNGCIRQTRIASLQFSKQKGNKHAF